MIICNRSNIRLPATSNSGKSKVFRYALGALLLALSIPANAQQPKKVSLIGYLSGVDPATDSPRSAGLRRALREFGYVEERNIAFEYRYGEGKPDREAELAAQLVSRKVDIIVVAGGSPWIRAAKNATKMIPIVMMSLGTNPVQAGLVESLARPGGNVTGITLLTRELGAKRLEILKETVPKLARVAVLYDSTAPGSVFEINELLPVAAPSLGLTIRPWDIYGSDGLERLFDTIIKDRPDGLYVLAGGGLIRPNYNRIADFASKSRLPSTYGDKLAIGAGGLMYYGADREDSYRRAATYVDRILKGEKPADLPVEQLRKFKLVINLKAAKEIGLTIPPSVLRWADEVIK